MYTITCSEYHTHGLIYLMKNNQQKLSRCALRQLLQLIAATCYSDDCSVYPTRAIGFGNSNGNDRRVFSLAATVSATVAATVGSGVFRGGAGVTAPPPAPWSDREFLDNFCTVL